MEHFYQNIGEDWFSYPQLYKRIVDNSQDGSHIVEVGSWKGRSAAFMAVEIINSNKKIKFDCVDTWEGTKGEHDTEMSVINGTLFDEFLNNIKPLTDNGLTINVIKSKSQECDARFSDDFFDFIYIDGSHYYEDVKQDIIKYLPKLKKTGTFAGHDWQSEDIRKAVGETLGLQNIKTVHNTWIYQPTKN